MFPVILVFKELGFEKINPDVSSIGKNELSPIAIEALQITSKGSPRQIISGIDILNLLQFQWSSHH